MSDFNRERFSRQKDLVNADNLARCNISVIGVGAIGRQCALQLAAIGASNLQLIDHDIVEPSNLASQGYYENDLGQAKVDATGKICMEINKGINLSIHSNRFRRSLGVGNVIFCCVDKINTRETIWNTLKDKVDFFVDGRMSGEVLRVLAAAKNNIDTMEHYTKTLFAPEEAQRGSCTAKSTIYCANIAAGKMVSKFALWLRGDMFEQDVLTNLITDEISVPEV